MKWDFAIGNPAYQETQDGTSDKPVYNYFMDEAYKIADSVEMITPARFLFNAGKTPKAWNEMMLQDEHFKVMDYEPDASKVFSNTEIKGGVAITYRTQTKKYPKIEIFTPHKELNAILQKIIEKSGKFVSSIVYAPESYKFTEKMHEDNPDANGKLSNGHRYDITSNIFDKLYPMVFFEAKQLDSSRNVGMLGRKDSNRIVLYIKKEYIAPHDNLGKYKLAFPKVNGNGTFGETLTSPEILAPGLGHTQTFLSMGAFETQIEVENLSRYLKTKFARTLLGVLKVTQDNKKGVWKYVPLQDFTSASDIDWSVSVANIDKQLYRKYGLTQEEIDFIEKNVKEME